MAKRKKIEVTALLRMDDDASINVSAEADHIWSIANTLRGTYSSNFVSYIEGFSANIQEIINNLEFKKEIEKEGSSG